MPCLTRLKERLLKRNLPMRDLPMCLKEEKRFAYVSERREEIHLCV
jgi:hypothetical protein